MIFSRRAALNGAELDEAHERIVIQGIECADGKENISAISSAAGNGQRVTGRRRDTVDVVIKFGIDIRRTDLEGRAEALEAVNAWAAKAVDGAWLTLNYKPDRRLWVRLAQAPGEANLWEWNKDFQIVLRAYEIPYWENAEAESAEIGTVSLSSSGTFHVDGSAPATAAVEMQNMSGAEIKRMTVTVNAGTMSFESLGLMADETLVIDHSDGGLVRIRIRAADGTTYRSAMAARTPTSADDFIAMPGDRTASFSAQRACKMTVRWRCRYL